MVNARPWFLTNSETVSSPPNRDPGNGNGGPPPAGWTGRGRGGGWGKGGKKGAGGNGFDGVLDIAIVRLAAPTHGTPTTQDFTVAGFGTPKAAIFLTGWVGTDDTAANNMSASFGATDGTNQWFSHCSSQHNVGPGASTRGKLGNTDGVGALKRGSNAVALSAKIAVNSWIPDGVRVDWTYPSSSDTEGLFVTCILFGGSAVSASAGVATLAGSGASTTLTPNFETHVGIFHSPGTTMDGTLAADASSVFGVMSNDGVTILQASRHWGEGNGSDPTSINNIVSSSGVLAKFSGAHVKVENITSTQIDLTSVSATFTDWDNTGYLLLNIGSGEAWAGVLDSPTSTGVKSFEDPSIEPIFGMLSLGMVQTVGTNVTDADAQSFGFGAFTENEEFSTAGFAQDNKTISTNTKSWASQSAVSFTNDGSAAAFAGTLDSFDAAGANTNFTTADGTVRKWPALFIGRGA